VDSGGSPQTCNGKCGAESPTTAALLQCIASSCSGTCP
jgi:hypothetical protein